MKKIVLLFALSVMVFAGRSQTVAFHENFELPSLGDSVVSSGIPTWGISTHLQHAGLRSDTSKVATNDTSFLTTASFSTAGNYYVILQFSHICKVEFFDNAIIQVSNNNGATWTQLTGPQYLGTGQFTSNGNKFASTSYVDWLPAQPTAAPTNLWWKTEQFDISSIAANSSQVKVRFRLSDGNGTGAGGNYGWLIDDIKVTMNYSELNPPVITLLPPNYTGTVYSIGPFVVNAKITDVSGIDQAKIFYTVNGGALNTVGMNVIAPDTFQGFIPAVINLDTVCFYVYAEDASPNHNSAQAPSSGCNSFVASSGITFPYYDNFDGFNNWTATATSTTVWQLGTPNYGTTNSVHSAPNAWDVNLTTAYGASANCTLSSPVFDFSTAVNAKMSFWINYYTEQSYDGTRLEYTTNGTTWQVLGTVGDPNGVNWYTMSSIYSSSLPAWAGTSGGWIKAEYTLSLLNNVVGPVQFRFIFTSDPSVQYDGFSIDDFSIALPSPQDGGVTSVIAPDIPGCIGGTPTLEVAFKNFGTLNIVGPMNIGYSIDGNTPVIEQYNGTLTPGNIDTMTFATPISAGGGAHSIKIFTMLASDGNMYNDTLSSSFVMSAQYNLPYFNTLDSAADLAEFCTNTGLYGTVMLSATAANTGAAGMLMGVNAYTGWTNYSNDTIPTSINYIWNNNVNEDQLSQARLVLNTTGYSNLVLKFDAKLLYLYGNFYTNFRVTVNGIQITPHMCPNNASTPYTTYEYELAAFLPSPSLTIEFEAKNYYPYTYSPNGNEVFLDNVQVYEPPAQEAAMIAMTSPVTGCGLGMETVKIKIKNKGSDTIAGGLNASYKVIGNTPVTEAVPGTILPGDTLLYSFATPLNMTVATTDSTFNLVSWVDLTGDPFQFNDTTTHSAISYHVPAAPIVTNATIPYATSTTLTSVSPDTSFWFASPTATNPLQIGSSYTTPILFGNTVYYVEAAAYVPGNHTVVGNGAFTEMYVPCNGDYNYSWSAIIYDNNELNFQGRIDTIAFYVSNATSFLMLNQIIYMTEVLNASFTSTNLPNSSTMTQIFSGNITWTGPGWFKIPLQTPFDYSGNNHLMLYWENHDGSYTGGYPYFYYTTTTTNQVIYNYQDVSFPTTAGYYTTSRPNIDFIHTMKGCPSPRVPDTVFVTGTPACDVSVISIDAPVSGIELSSTDTVIIEVKNYGTSPQSNVPVNYSVNGGTAVTEIIPGPIASGDTVVYAFTTTVDLSAYATYNLEAYTSLLCDNVHINDTVSTSITNSSLIYCTSSALYPNYYEDIGNVTFSNINNGNPLPVISNSTAINGYTDFTGITPAYLSPGSSYPISVSLITTNTYLYDTYVKVFIDYNRDGTLDMATETAFEGNATSLMPTITGNVLIPGSAVTNKLMLMRVVAQEYGDSTTTTPCGTYYYGETEDYFVMIMPRIPHDAGITEIIKPALTENEAAVVPVIVVVKNYGTDTIYNGSNMNIDYSINGGTAVTTLYTGGPLPPSASDTVTLPSTTITYGNNTICAYTVLAGDSNVFNDQTCKSYFGNPLHDAGVIQILQPGTTAVTGSSQPVQVVCQNFGVNTITSMNLAYTINGGTPVIQAWTGSLASGSQTTVTLPSFTVPSSAFAVCSYTILTADEDHSNDTTCISSFGLSMNYLPYCNNFDGSIVDWYDQSVGTATIWQLGTPSYGVTNSAHSAPNAWDVNLATGYASSADAMLYTQIFNFANVIDAQMSFWQNRYCESSWDGTRIDYTLNGGTTWQVLGTTTSPNATNWYTNSSLYSSSLPGWDGSSSGWINSTYILTELNNEPAVQFRFVFTSDGSVNYDGFSLDDFCILADTFTDAGISKIVQPAGTITNMVPTTVIATIKNYGFTSLVTIPVRYIVNGADSVTEHWSGTLAPGDSVNYSFITQYTPPAMSFYAFCVKTTDMYDSIPANNKKCKQYYTNLGIDDMSDNTFFLGQNIPNPANGSTIINYYLPEEGEYNFYVMNSIGQKIYTESSKAMAGAHQVNLDVSGWNAGIYIYVMEFNGDKCYRKMVLTK